MNVYHDKYNKKRPVIHFRVNPAMKRKLVKLAKIRRIKVSKLVLNVVVHWLNLYEN